MKLVLYQGRSGLDGTPAFSFRAGFRKSLLCITLLQAGCLFVETTAQHTPSSSRDPTPETLPDVEHLIHEGLTVEAEDRLQAILAHHERSAAAHTTYGNLLLSRKHYAEAMKHFEAALRLSPQSVAAGQGEENAAVALALHYRALHDEDRAIATLEQATAMVPKNPVLLADLGVEAMFAKRWTIAEHALQAAHELAPRSASTIYALARTQAEQDRFSAAEALYQDYFGFRPDDASAHYGLGRALRMQQKNEEACREFQRSIALQPVQTEAYYQLGEIALESGHDDEARANYQKTLDRLPTHGGALTGMGMLAYRRHDYAAAKISLDRAVAASPDYQPAHYYLGLALRRLSDTAGAERELHIATELARTQQGKGTPVAAQ